jgi:peptide methionine sulfoxide reductase MsrA
LTGGDLYRELVELSDRPYPTQASRQGPDIGTNCQSAIFTTPRTESIAEVEEEGQSPPLRRRTMPTEIVPAKEYYPAEEYHQKFFEKQGRTCHL